VELSGLKNAGDRICVAGAGLVWRPLGGSEWTALVVLALGVILMAWPHLPRGVCTGDAGDLQLAATVLGIPHPPGYAGYVSLAHLATYIPGVEPASLVSAFCMIAGVGVLLLCALLAIRLGASAWAAGSVALLLTAHPRFWQNLTTPEIYVFSMAFLSASVYALTHYALTGRRRSVYVTALLFGVAVANRPPILMAAPFFLLAWWLARRTLPPLIRGDKGGSQPPARGDLGGSLPAIFVLGLFPALYSLAYLYVRDRPEARYNYIEQHNAEAQELPDSRGGVGAKVTRAIWMASGRQFHDRAVNSWPKVRGKCRWLRGELGVRPLIAPITLAMIVRPLAFATIVGCGVFVAFRRSPPAALALCGVFAQGVLFILMYGDFGQAADLLPVLIPLTVFAAVATQVLFIGRSPRTRRAIAAACVIAAVAFTARDLPDRPNFARPIDAEDFLKAADLATFPADSVILAHWIEALPLLYECEVRTRRTDIDIVTAQPVNWPRMAERFPDRPVFAVHNTSFLRGRTLTPFRNVWRLEPESERQ
jgi:hypothetical protein